MGAQLNPAAGWAVHPDLVEDGVSMGALTREMLQTHLTAELVWLRLWGKDISRLPTKSGTMIESVRRQNILPISFKQFCFSFMLLSKN